MKTCQNTNLVEMGHECWELNIVCFVVACTIQTFFEWYGISLLC